MGSDAGTEPVSPPTVRYLFCTAQGRRQVDSPELGNHGVLEQDIREVGEHACKEWLNRYRQRYTPSVVNNSLGVMRAVLQEAMDAGALFGNPAGALKRAKVRSKKLKLPSRKEFSQFVQVIESGGSRDSKNAADLVRFLAYSGLRIGESKHVTWHDLVSVHSRSCQFDGE